MNTPGMNSETTESEDDPFANLPEHELEALQKAEWRSVPKKNEDSRFSHLPLLEQEFIYGTYFSAFDNSAHVNPDETDHGGLAEELWKVPLLLYSEKNRFAYMCDIAHRYWILELDEFVNLLLAIEACFREKREPSEDLEWQLESFALRATPENYIIGYRGATSPIIARPELLQKVLILVARGLTTLEKPDVLKFDPAQILAKLEATFKFEDG